MKNVIKNNKMTIGLFCVLLITITVLSHLSLASNSYSSKFTQVSKFSQPAKLITTTILHAPRGTCRYFLFLDLSQDLKLQYGPLINDKVNNDFGGTGFIGVCPDNKSIFIGVEDRLLELDNKLNIKRTINIAEFNFEPNDIKYEFGEICQVSDRYVWFAVNKIKQTSKYSRTTQKILVEWEYDKPVNNNLIAKMETFEGFALNETDRITYTFGTPSITAYNFSTQKIISPQYGRYDFIDLISSNGFLLSKSVFSNIGDDPVIIMMKSLESPKVVVANGFNAVWGMNGLIYYSDSQYRLWRCQSDGGNKELVYETNLDKACPNTHFPVIKLSNDRTFLAYRYFSQEKSILVLMDLKKSEYLELENQVFDNMAFLLGSNSTHKCN